MADFNEKVFTSISNRQTQMMDFWKAMEGIRWRFTSSFGVGAIVALFLSIDQIDPEKSLVPVIILFILSIASIICQLRIYGVLASVWQKVILLQKLEMRMLENLAQFPNLTEDEERAFYFPQPLPSKMRLVSITGTSCSVFIMLAALALYLFMRIFKLAIFQSLLFSGVFFIAILIIVIFALNKSMELAHQSKPAMSVVTVQSQ